MLVVSACATRVPRAANDEEKTASGELARAKALYEEGKGEEAIQVANAALARTRGQANVSARTIAGLTEAVANASFAIGDADSSDRWARALSAWEKVPNADDEIAHAAGLAGFSLVLYERDLAAAEKLYRRAFTILQQRHGSSDPVLYMTVTYLLDLFDQECRIDEYERMLAQLEKIYDAHPGEEYAEFYRFRARAVGARLRGDVAAALSLMQRAIDELEKCPEGISTSRASVRGPAYALIEGYAFDLGSYAAALSSTELESQQRVEGAYSEGFNADYTLWLHFAYEAAGDKRQSEQDDKLHVRAAHAGESLFPSRLPTIARCAPEIGPDASGRAMRASDAEEMIEQCLENGHEPDAQILIFMRQRAGAVVAVEVAGVDVDQAALECMSRGALDLSFSKDQSFNFDTWSWFAKN